MRALAAYVVAQCVELYEPVAERIANRTTEDRREPQLVDGMRTEIRYDRLIPLAGAHGVAFGQARITHLVGDRERPNRGRAS